jgi:hypothetical protein
MLLFRRIVFRHRLGTMQRQHHADVSMHERPAIFCRHQNRFAMPVMVDRALHANGGIVTKVEGWVDPVSEKPVPKPTHWKAWGARASLENSVGRLRQMRAARRR